MHFVLSILEQLLMHQGMCVYSATTILINRRENVSFRLSLAFFWLGIYFSFPTFLFPLEIKTLLKDPGLLNQANFVPKNVN